MKMEAETRVMLRQGRGSQRLEEPRGEPSLQPLPGRGPTNSLAVGF